MCEDTGHLPPLRVGAPTWLGLEDAEGNEVFGVDVRVGGQKCVELGVTVRPGKLGTRGASMMIV